MNKTIPTMAQQLAQVVRTFQEQQTGRIPKSVTVVLSEDTLITGREVREAAAEFDPTTDCIIHAFTTGAVAQMFLLADSGPAKICATDGVAVPA